MPCSYEAYLKHLRSLARRGCFPDVCPFEAVPRPFGTHASLPRPHDFQLFRTAEHSKAPLRCGIDRIGAGGPSAVMRFA
jgi:hypothetical protein